MKTLKTTYIGGITLLTLLKCITVIMFSTYIVCVLSIGFFTIPAFISFLIFVALFLICTHKPKHNPKMFSQQQLNKHHANWNIINKRLKEIATIILLFISFSVSAQNLNPKDKFEKDTLIKNVNYKIYKGTRGGRYYWKLSLTTNEFTKRYIPKKSKK